MPSASNKKCEKFQYIVTPTGPMIVPVLDEHNKDEEAPSEYNQGGYLVVRVKDTFKEGRYVVVRKLGYVRSFSSLLSPLSLSGWVLDYTFGPVWHPLRPVQRPNCQFCGGVSVLSL